MRSRTLLRLAAQLLGVIVLAMGFAGGLVAQPTITTSSLPNAVDGVLYPSQTLSATGGAAPYTWTVSAGLPAGLTLDSTGLLHGTTSATPGLYSFTVQVTDSASQISTAQLSITVTATMTITTTSPLQPGLVGVSYAQTLAANGTAPVTWSLISDPSTLPPGVTLSSTGSLTGTPTMPGTFNFTVQASDSSSPVQTNTATFQVVINSVTITNTSLPNGAANPSNPYSQQLTAIGGTQPYTWTVSSGALPAGFTLNPTTGLISGTTAAAGNYAATFHVADSSTPALTAIKSFSLTIQPLLAIATTSPLPGATIGVFYSQPLTTAPNSPPATWSVTAGVLPPGLSLTQNGTLTGSPSASGTFTFTILATSGTAPTQTASQAFQLVVSPASTPSITTSSLPNGSNGVAYSAPNLTAVGGTSPYVWSIVSGSLPTGLTLSSSGNISGTPTASGTFNFSVGITDSSVPALTASRALTIIIQPGVTINTASTLPIGEVGAFYAQPFSATGPTPLSWTLLSGIVPPGLSVTPTGSLQGTPAVAGTYDFTVQAAGGNPVQTGSQAFHIVINAGLTITTSVTLPNAALAPYSVALTVTGGTAPYTWTILQGTIPPGLSLSSAGLLSGTPTSLGSFSFVAQVSDGFTPAQTTNRTFTIVVSQLTITTLTLPDGMLNLPYNQQLQPLGSGLTWTATGGTLPPGLTLSTTGLLAGTPLALGSTTFTVTVTNSTNATSSQTYTFTVDPAVAALSVTSLPATLNPTQSFPIALSLAAPHPSDITGELVLTFTSKAEVQGDDPMTEFSTGTRTVNFTIPANTTNAVFTPNVLLLVGTVSGTVTLTANIDNGPQGLSAGSVSIPATAPQITSITASRTAGGVEVQISGYASARRVTSAEFDFTLKSGPAPALIQDVSTDFSAWYNNVASVVFGSGFSYVQSFTVTGDTSQIQSVTVILTNAQGSTSSASIPLP